MSALSEETKTLLIIGGILVLLYFLYIDESKSIPDEPFNEEFNQEEFSNISSTSTPSSPSASSSVTNSVTNFDNSSSTFQEVPKKSATSSGSSTAPKVAKKEVSFSNAVERSQNSDTVSKQFDSSNNLTLKSPVNVFDPVGVGVNTFSESLAELNNSFNNQFTNASDRLQNKNSQSNMFDLNNLMPQQTNPDWFEVIPDPISVNNRHLINVTRPVGINTVGTSLRNPSYDIRGSPACPKFVVSPWNQSSIDPDVNLKPIV
jgi:hypothetical protein